MSLQEEFDTAVKYIQNLPKDGPYQPSNDTKLKFYAWYKQVTVGPNDTAKPGMLSLDLVGKAKWEAWKKLGDMSKDEAMKLYVEEFKKVKALAGH